MYETKLKHATNFLVNFENKQIVVLLYKLASPMTERLTSSDLM